MRNAPSSIGAFAVCALLAGCGRSTLSAPAQIPSYTIDVNASELVVARKNGEIATDAADENKGFVAAALAEAVDGRPDLSKAKPARFRAQVVYDAAPSVTTSAFSSTEAWVRLTLDISGERFVGSGSASSNVGYLFFGGTPGRALKGSVMYATQAALRDAMTNRKAAEVR